MLSGLHRANQILRLRMTLLPSALPRDVRSLRRVIVEKEALLREREQIIAEKEAQLAERDRLIAVRDAELYSKTLQIEHFRAQLAVLRRARLRRSSERSRHASSRATARRAVANRCPRSSRASVSCMNRRRHVAAAAVQCCASLAKT
jgi:hypothetical protein